MKGIIHITGEHDTGKTLAALGLYHPKEIAFFHDDIKMPPIPLNEFGFCVNLIDTEITFGKLREFVLNQIEEIPAEVKCIVFDTFTRFESSCQVYGKANAHLTRERDTMAKGREFLYGQQWGEARYYVAKVINDLNNRFETVILVTHLKDHYEAGKKTGKEIPASSDVLNRVCNARFWLRQNQDGGVPIILILKRPPVTKVGLNGLEIVNAYPRRIRPQPEERSIWDCLKRYQSDPINNRPLDPSEQPTSFELSILDGILTEDQKEIWRANLQMPEDEIARQDMIDDRVRELGEERKAPMEIIGVIKEEFGEEMKFSTVVGLIG